MTTSTELVVDWRKWPDAPYRRTPMRRLGVDEVGTWLHAPRGTRTSYRDPLPVNFLTLVPAGSRWWLVTWMWGNDEIPIDVYVDIVHPPSWEETGLRVIDLDLDVIRFQDGTIAVDDEDEFAEHTISLQYPREIVRGARAAADAMFAALSAGAPPFGDESARWRELVS